jgi:hypothetical protein
MNFSECASNDYTHSAICVKFKIKMMLCLNALALNLSCPVLRHTIIIIRLKIITSYEILSGTKFHGLPIYRKGWE